MPSSHSKRAVRLIKTDGVLGPLPVGAQYEALHARNITSEQANLRTWRMFKRDHPQENPMCWTVEGSVSDRAA